MVILETTKQLDENIYELRLTTGPAYRVYYAFKDNKLIILLTDGDKSSQKNDILKVKKLIKKSDYE